MCSILSDVYDRYRIVHGCVEHYKSQKQRFDDGGKGKWITTKDGNHVYLNEEGEPEKGNPYVIAAMNNSSPKYSAERLQKAVNPQTPEEADNLYRKKSGEVWQSLLSDSKDALVDFTGDGYVKVNSALRYGDFYDDDEVQDEIDSITSAISKSKLEKDAWFRRGVELNALKNMLGASEEISPDNLSSLVGKTGQEKGFLSCGSTFDTGIDSDVSLRIFAPAGTEALYAEPFSVNGRGEKRFWDGKTKQNTFSDEMETIIQRGSCFQCVGARYRDDGVYEVDLAITSQKYD